MSLFQHLQATPSQRCFLFIACLVSTGVWTPLETFADDDGDKPVPTVMARHTDLANGRTFDAVLPGKPLSVAAFPGGDLAVLILPEADEDEDSDEQKERRPALYRLATQVGSAAEPPEPWISDLPVEVDTLVRKGPEVWLGGEDALYRLPNGADSADDLERLLELPGLDVSALKRRGLLPKAADAPLAVPELGQLTLYRAHDGRLETLHKTPLPVRTRRKSTGLELWSPTVLSVAGQVGKLWGTTTEPVSDSRFRAQLIRPGEGEPKDWLEESYFRFERPEDIQQHHWVTIDGRTALIVGTTPGDKLGLFQKLKLRVFYTGADRTRAGRKPTTAFQTATRRWYSFTPYINDVTGDGHDDLVLVQTQGLSGDHMVIDVFPGKGNGRFHDKDPLRTRLEDFYGGFHFGTDFNGDGKGDVVLKTSRRLRIFSVDTSGSEVLADRPFFTLDRDPKGDAVDRQLTEVTLNTNEGGTSTEHHSFSTRGRLTIMAVDDDERPELVLLRNVEGRAVVRVIWVSV